jgi:hypothetical protein
MQYDTAALRLASAPDEPNFINLSQEARGSHRHVRFRATLWTLLIILDLTNKADRIVAEFRLLIAWSAMART